MCRYSCRPSVLWMNNLTLSSPLPLSAAPWLPRYQQITSLDISTLTHPRPPLCTPDTFLLLICWDYLDNAENIRCGPGMGGAILNYLISLNILQSILILQIQERAPGLTALNVKMLFGVFRYASGNTARSLTDGIQAGWISTHF